MNYFNLFWRAIMCEYHITPLIPVMHIGLVPYRKQEVVNYKTVGPIQIIFYDNIID